ncbi:unnamed protein product [Caenorhabditis angaria]|uniref:Forkhead box protein pes-1 n=1 Tax=Caenorhabditis angaria TaxID=860376 RepID=A0A9P1IAK2_9PELO|nr:unnamed protein product [Caenorhabditis angaria]
MSNYYNLASISHQKTSVKRVSKKRNMGELNSSLCQLNWLIAKGGMNEETAKNQEFSSSSSTSKSAKYKNKSTTWLNGEEKPPFSYSELIKFAIDGTSSKRCTLSGIYSYIAENFQFYRENRNPSWRNSIRHNLSLNRQFKRLDKMDGDKACYWICVQPPQKKPRILGGAPARINPAIEKMFLSKKQPKEPSDQHLSEKEIHEMNLFESCDLNGSFRAVYDQIFEKNPQNDKGKQAAQIDWLKISLETAGLDYNDEQEMNNVDTDKFKEYMSTNTYSEHSSMNSRSVSVESSGSTSYIGIVPIPPKDDSDDDFDWNLII